MEIESLERACKKNSIIYSYSLNYDNGMNYYLESLFRSVDDYAKRHHILASKVYGEKYNLVNKNNAYELGVLYGPNSIYYAKKVNKDELDSYVDYNDVLSDKVSSENLYVEERVNQIISSLNELREAGISKDIIEYETHRQLRLLK